jgi:hypothetical protein
MPSNQLHNWAFSTWEGPTPSTPREHVSAHTQAGMAGQTHVLLGKWGEPFDAKISAYYTTFLAANDARYKLVEPLVAAGLVRLWWNGLDYLVRYNTLFQVARLGAPEVVSLISVVSAGVAVSGAAKLTVPVTLIPHEV